MFNNSITRWFKGTYHTQPANPQPPSETLTYLILKHMLFSPPPPEQQTPQESPEALEKQYQTQEKNRKTEKARELIKKNSEGDCLADFDINTIKNLLREDPESLKEALLGVQQCWDKRMEKLFCQIKERKADGTLYANQVT